jgi:uncharacterized RDD family membrane protein YckC
MKAPELQSSGMGMEAVASDERSAPAIAGIWRRLAAFAVDLVVLGLPTLVVGLILYRWASGLGQAGRLVGLAETLLYFGLLDSRLTSGRTPGKRLLQVRVVDRSGKPLSPPRAALRCLVVALPYFLNGLWLDLAPGDPLFPVLAPLLLLLVLGTGGALLYLIVCNRRTRQSLQDLAVGSFVVRAGHGAGPIAGSTPRLHLVVAGGWVALVLVGSAIGTWSALDPARLAVAKPTRDLQAALAAELGLASLRVNLGTTDLALAGSGSAGTSYLQVTAFPSASEGTPDALLIPRIAEAVLRRRPDLLGRQLLIVQTIRGFDLGLAWWSKAHRGAFDAAGWRELLQSPAGGARSD